MAHDKREFTINGKQMWFHLHTDTVNIFLAKKAWSRCWTGPSPDEEKNTSPRETIQGSHMQVELYHHDNIVERDGADNVDYREVHVEATGSFPATGKAQLTLPDGQAISLEAPA